MSANISIISKIRAGAAYLDSVYGKKWRRKIRLKTLDISSCKNCVLGQTDGDYRDHASKLGLSLSRLRAYGFTNDQGLPSMKSLTAAWKKYLRKSSRKNEPTDHL